MNNLEAQISTEKLLRFLNADPEKLRVAALEDERMLVGAVDLTEILYHAH